MTFIYCASMCLYCTIVNVHTPTRISTLSAKKGCVHYNDEDQDKKTQLQLMAPRYQQDISASDAGCPWRFAGKLLKGARDDASFGTCLKWAGYGGISFDTTMSVVLIEADCVFENTTEDRQ